MAPTETFLCCICLENVCATQRVVLSQCGKESHASCGSCLKMYLRLRVEEARVDDLRCPSSGIDGCEAFVTEQERQELLSEATEAKYTRFSAMRDDPKLRACPTCSSLCSPDVSEDGKVTAEMSCKECGSSFCYHHTNAHPPGPEACAEYERCIVKQQLDVGLYGTKPCPACGFSTEKVSGCNHMTCRCGVNWCWVCSQKFDNIGWHYNPANPAGCMQFQQELSSRRDGDLMVVCKICALPAVLVAFLFVVVFVLSLAATVCVFACTCFSETGFKVWIGITGVIVGIPFILFSIAWAIVGLVIWLMLLPFGAGEVHLQFLLGVPFMTALALGEGSVTPGGTADTS
mmetsp:Transcript_5990/g.15294  ORF Transcript_5990/g.15294 Transcript_5990/m.15294 type:complete len:345 (-) Transcript_5990:76-1110(-)|eukprot:CAMPEP_0195053546 /NCGR_PEP_ID=MMETSP0448-20130528/2621_1 /TAXON_ID=66468 /ORGANISM="Heterocapsa triquestra, Strain CCMP 448" /LENGTH=344 /DNA_ID=CAMNT_0040082841 /DNA_START=38 /DNA_END=1072 /DNA_ORIENTATION=-